MHAVRPEVLAARQHDDACVAGRAVEISLSQALALLAAHRTVVELEVDDGDGAVPRHGNLAVAALAVTGHVRAIGDGVPQDRHGRQLERMI